MINCAFLVSTEVHEKNFILAYLIFWAILKNIIMIFFFHHKKFYYMFKFFIHISSMF